MEGEFLRLERPAAGVARLVLDRPPLNVLHLPMLGEMERAIAELAADRELKLLVLTGPGKAFCAGVDVADHTADRVGPMLESFHGVIQTLMLQDFPIIGAVNGAALGGGCELLLACDLVIASERAKLGQPEIQLGVFPPVAAAFLPRLIGRQAALDLILTGRVVSAAEAREMGLVGRVVPAEAFEDAVEELVGRLAALSRPVLRLTKRTVVEGLERPAWEPLDRAEEVYLRDLMELADPHEGLAAFLEKRKPVWKDA
ncbi:MAG: enoyl-CoA hydratase/isomerase family protein [Gemmatimonadota bacterium]|nr:MAG: enoyl-CoA hydratase/isomerase family protein [Gemmatimonadota bacterium]